MISQSLSQFGLFVMVKGRGLSEARVNLESRSSKRAESVLEHAVALGVASEAVIGHGGTPGVGVGTKHGGKVVLDHDIAGSVPGTGGSVSEDELSTAGADGSGTLVDDHARGGLGDVSLEHAVALRVTGERVVGGGEAEFGATEASVHGEVVSSLLHDDVLD